jgi:sucrose phosphorylase
MAVKPENRIWLITYPDSMGRNIRELRRVLDTYFSGAVGGVHLLPFFPSTGDRGFAPTDYRKVDDAFGTWEDVKSLSNAYRLMTDFMINHISAGSAFYKDFLTYKDGSAYRDMFIRYKDFWPNGEPDAREAERIYKRKPKEPSVVAHFADGTEEKVWCTFSDEQIDLDCTTAATRDFIKNTLTNLAAMGSSIIRLDAFAYAIKKAGTSCFFVEPDIWELLSYCARVLKPFRAKILPEIHEHYSIQLKLAKKGFPVYDFALPMLLLNAIYYGRTACLKNWLRICPRKQFTTLDTHDGLGVVDVRGLLPDDALERTREDIFRYGANVKKIYNTSSYNNLDIYQINCTYYSALGDDDDAYLLARAVQFFAPGTPQVYYVGLLAGRNDIKLLEETKEGRNINRHYYGMDEVAEEVRRPVVQKLIRLMEFRNTHPAFDGSFELLDCAEDSLVIRRSQNGSLAQLSADFPNRRFTIQYSGPSGIEELDLSGPLRGDI